MDTEQLKKERIQLFKDTIRGKRTKGRFANFGNLWSWKICDAGYTLSEALGDYGIMEQVMRHTFETYKMDAFYETGWRNPIQVTESLGNDEYVINDQANAISINDQCFMEAEEYDALICNPKKFLWEIFLPRKYKYLKKENNSEDFRNMLQKYGEFGAFMGKISQVEAEEYGIPDFADPNAAIDYWGNGYEMLFCILRGIKGLAYDIRRMPEKVKDAIEALDETFAIPRLARGRQQPMGSNMNYCVDSNPVMLGHTILSPKQFEKFYWPHLQRLIDLAVNDDKLIYLFVEGDSERFYDFFQEFPKDHFAIHTEQNDIFEMKKKLPNMTICGGMTSELLGNGTPDACVDYAKRLIDELGYDGRYIFSENKMVSFKYDCKSENLKAVCDFVYTYER